MGPRDLVFRAVHKEIAGKGGFLIPYFLLNLLIVQLSLCLFPAPLAAGGTEGYPRVIMLVVDGLSPREWQQAAEGFPGIKDFLDRSSLALMNTGTGGRLNSGNAYVTIGAGTRALAAPGAGRALEAGERYGEHRAEEIYFRWVGQYPRGEVFHPEIYSLVQANRPLGYRVVPGTLGELVKGAGLYTGVLGNGDRGELNRLGVLLAMDRQGTVDHGRVSRDFLAENGEYPGGYYTPLDSLWQEYLGLEGRVQLLVIDWGDASRLGQERDLMDPGQASFFLDRLLGDLECFLGRLLPRVGEETLLLLFTPNPSGLLAPWGGQLSLLAIYPGQGTGLLREAGPHHPRAGSSLAGGVGNFPPFAPGAGGRGDLLTSGSTRRPGLVTNLDIVPTILGHLGIGVPAYLPGSGIASSSRPGGLGDLLALDSLVHQVHRQRPFLVRAFILLQITGVLGAVTLLLAGGRVRGSPSLARYLKGLLATLMLVPPAFLLLPLGMPGDLYLVFLGVAMLAGGLTWLLYRGTSYPWLFFRVGLLVTLSLVLDQLTGGNLIRNSVLGYDPLSGARFYGIGNEYMGVLIGGTVLGVSSLYQLYPGQRLLVKGVSLAYMVFVAYLLVSPRWGANFGGSLAALVAFTAAFLGLEGYRLNKKTLAAAAGTALLFTLALVLLNYRGEQGSISHVGRSLALIESQGLGEVVNIVSRKGAMNLKLFRYSLWSRVLLVFLGLMVFLFYQPPGLLRGIRQKYSRLFTGFTATLAGSIAAILVNDSGVVAGATTLMYAGLPLFILALEVSYGAGGTVRP